MSNFIQDTINFQLRADTIVTNDTVKISVAINALVTTDTTEVALRRDIKDALGRFVEAEWHIHGIERSSDDSGFERVGMRATARVKETENYNLENRARKVSRQGLQLSGIGVDSTVPAPKHEEAEKKLRSLIMIKAKEELAEICEMTNRKYRLGSVRFANQGDPAIRKQMTASSTMSYNSYGAAGGSAGEGEESLNNSQRVSLAADIVFSVTEQS